MDAGKIATLKRKLIEATDFGEIADYFLDNLGNDLAFMMSGERYADTRFVTALAQAVTAASGSDGGVFQGTPRRMAEHRLVHGAFTFGPWTGMMFYFEDVEQGFLALGDEQGPSRFCRFSLVESPDGKPITIH